MEKLTHLAVMYFRRRTYFRVGLIVLILFLWGYIEIGDLTPLREHDLNWRNLKAIAAGYHGGPTTFAVLGDPKNSPVFQQIVSKMNKDTALQFAIIGGDLVVYPDKETFGSFLEQRRDLEIPSLTLPGNHDVAFDSMYLYYHIFGRMYYAFVLGSSKFILLDNSNETDFGHEQEAWLERELKDGMQYKYRFVFMHVPLWDPRDKSGGLIRYAHSLNDPDAARRMEELLLKYKVTMLFASHIHAYYQTTTRGLRTVISGGAGAELVGKDPEHTFYHYVRVTVTDQGIQTAVVKLEKAVPFGRFRRYLSIAGLYCRTMGRIYAKYILMFVFILTLVLDGLLEFYYQQKQRQAAPRGI
jgi:serine/threonine-protein phosphatase CPPED1